MNRIVFKDLEDRIRKVPLLNARNSNGSSIFVYENADIELRNVSPDELNPTTFYLLRKNLEFQRNLRMYMLSEYGIDTLKLDCALELENFDSGEEWTLMPPVVEVSEESVMLNPENDLKYDLIIKVKIPLINDGAHRIYLSRELGERINVIHINDILKEHPLYAYPNPWDMVNIVDTVPKIPGEKKFYRVSNPYNLYRDFGVLGCGAPRKLGT